MVTVLKIKPKLVGHRNIGYGGKIKETVTVYSHAGKQYKSGILYDSLEMALQDAGARDLIFHYSNGKGWSGWALLHPFKGKPRSKRLL